MLEFNSKTARVCSRLGQRGSAFGIAIPEIAKELEQLRVVAADMVTFSGVSKFQNQAPEKVINVGIAEQNMIGVASGLAKEGKVVFVTTYATFCSMRCFEQIRNNLGYMDFNVKIMASSAGMAIGMFGNQHYAIEDISLMRSIPNLIVMSPADAVEAVKMTYAVAGTKNPAYIRFTGGLNCPIVYTEDYEFEIGKAVTVKNGVDIAIIAIGTLVAEALKVAKQLDEKGISTRVINMHTIKPLDTLLLDEIFENFKAIITVEEHSIVGGLGSAVAEYKAQFANTPPQKMIGLPDEFGRPDEYEYLLDFYGLTAEKILITIEKYLKDI